MDVRLVEKKEIVVDEPLDSVIQFYSSKQIQFLLEQFLIQVKTFFELNPVLHTLPFPTVHSLKARLKDPEHLRD